MNTYNTPNYAPKTIIMRPNYALNYKLYVPKLCVMSQKPNYALKSKLHVFLPDRIIDRIILEGLINNLDQCNNRFSQLNCLNWLSGSLLFSFIHFINKNTFFRQEETRKENKIS